MSSFEDMPNVKIHSDNNVKPLPKKLGQKSIYSEEIKIDDDFILIRFQNDSNDKISFERQVHNGLIQFHFGLKGNAKFIFNQGSYTLDLKEEKSLLFYNPQKELPLNIEIAPKSWLISILVSIKKFHGLFSTDAEHIPFLSDENRD